MQAPHSLLSHPYSAALAGYTAAIIAADTLGATGASPLGRSLRFRQSCRCRNLSMRNGQWRRKKPLALTSHRWPSAAVKERSGKSRRFARTERRGFEPRTSTVQAPARLTGAASRSSAARRRRRRQLEPGLSPKPVPAPAECDRFAPRSAMAAWRKYRSLPEGAPNGSNRPSADLQDWACERARRARQRSSGRRRGRLRIAKRAWVRGQKSSGVRKQ
jgi:hypothetical protein